MLRRTNRLRASVDIPTRLRRRSNSLDRFANGPSFTVPPTARRSCPIFRRARLRHWVAVYPANPAGERFSIRTVADSPADFARVERRADRDGELRGLVGRRRWHRRRPERILGAGAYTGASLISGLAETSDVPSVARSGRGKMLQVVKVFVAAGGLLQFAEPRNKGVGGRKGSGVGSL